MIVLLGWRISSNPNYKKFGCALGMHASNPKTDGTACFILHPMISEKANIISDSSNGYDYKSFPPTSAWAGRGHKSVQQVEKFQGYI